MSHRRRGSVRGTQGSAARSLQRSPLARVKGASCARRRRNGGPAHGSGHAPRQSADGGRACGAGPGCNGRSLTTAGPAVNAPRSVSHFTFGRRKICEPHLAKMRDENASHRMDQPRRPGRAWPALVGCRDVQIGPHAQRGNQLGLDAVRQDGAGRTTGTATRDSNGTVPFRGSSGRMTGPPRRHVDEPCTHGAVTPISPGGGGFALGETIELQHDVVGQ